MLGHATTQIVPRFAQVLDQNRLEAMKKLDAIRQESISKEAASRTTSPHTLVGILS
jgi:hypothetical protein